MSIPETDIEKPAFTSNLLKGKKALVFGVANKRSIAWAISQALSNNGAQLAFTYQGERIKESVEKLVGTLPQKSPLYQCDVTKPEEVKSVFDNLQSEFGVLHCLHHCIAYAKK